MTEKKIIVSFKPLNWFKPNPKNTRTHSKAQIEYLASLIKEFGWTNPIIARSNGLIIAGHGRLEAAQLLGLKNAPVIIKDFISASLYRAYSIADNQSALLSGWDLDLLRQEIQDLSDKSFNVDLLGFDDSFIDSLLASGGSIDDSESVPDRPKIPKTKAGDVYRLGPHTLVCGDSSDASVFTSIMAAGSCAMIWTDPPYNVDYGTRKIQNDNMAEEEFKKFLLSCFSAFVPMLRKGGSIYVSHSDGGNRRNSFDYAWAASGLVLSSVLIWSKNSFVLGRSDYQWQHEPILYGWREGAAHRWYGGRKQATIQKFVDGESFRKTGDNEYTIIAGESIFVIRGQSLSVREELSSIIYEPKPSRNGEHPTMKPPSLIARHVRNSSRKGDIVLDAFGGSGSTLMACESTGRVAFLVEKDPAYCDVICDRWQAGGGVAPRRVHGKARNK